MSNIKLVDVVRKFHGEEEEDVELWLDRLHVAVEITSSAKDNAAKKKEIADIMPLFLEGRAYSTWKQLSETDRKDLAIVEGALRRVFGRTRISAWQELKSMRYNTGDAIDVVADRIQSLLKTIAGVEPAEEIVSLFVIDALPSHIADQVRLHHGEKLPLGPILSCIKGLVSATTDSVVAVGAQGRKENSSATVRCFRCGRRGHVASNCQTECFRCGQRGHIQRNCDASSVGRREPTVRNPGNVRAREASPERAALAVRSCSGESQSKDVHTTL